MLIVVVSTDAGADADDPDYWWVVGVGDGDNLNIRAQHNARSAKVAEIPPNGSCIANRDCEDGLSFSEYSTLNQSEHAKRLKENPLWCRIDFQGLTGWVAGRYLAEGECP